METQFEYSKYDTSLIDSERIDALIGIVLDSGKGYLASIIAGCKLLCVGVFVFIKWTMMKKDQEINKQKYEKKQTNNNKDQINEDSLD